MESITSKVCKTIKSYLRDKTYRRLTVRPCQSRPIRLGWWSWRAKNARKTIRLQSKIDSRMPLQTRTRRSYFTDVVVFLSGGEGGLVSGSRTGKKCNDDEVCSRQSPISRQVSLNGLELKRKTMLNVHIPELLPLRRSYSEGHGFANLRAVNSVRISVAAWAL